MMVGDYPITQIRHSIKSLLKQGFEIWYWFVGETAFECPMEPLTQEFWQKHRDARLAYGLILPAVDVRDRGDLLILVTQNLKQARHQRFGGLKVRQRYEIHSLLLEIDFTQVGGFKYMPVPMRLDIFRKFEDIFKNYLLPKKNDGGEYYREPAPSGGSELLRPDSQGKVVCPKCKRSVALGDGLIAMDSYPVEDGTMLIFAVCEHCEEIVGVNTNPPVTNNPKNNTN